MALNLQGKVSLDGSGFEAGIERMSHKLKEFAVEAFGIATVSEAIRKTVEAAGDLVNMSERLGISIEQLQVLQQAAKEAGADMGDLASAFEKFDIAREKALGGDIKLQGRFGALGISANDLHTMTAAQAFMGPLHQTAVGKNPEDLGPLLRDILGKGFGKVLPAMQTDFEDLEAKMRSFGSLMSTEAAVKVKYLADEFDLLSKIVLTVLAPALSEFAFWLVSKLGELKGVSSFAGSLTGSAGGVGKAVERELEYRRLKKQSDKAEDLGMTTPGDTLFGLFESDAHVPTAAEKDRMERYEKDLDFAYGGYKATTDDWGYRMDKVAKELAEKAERLKHPKPPVFQPSDEQDAYTPRSMWRKIPHMEVGDQLTKVGNFLGNGDRVFYDIQWKQVNLLQQIQRSNAEIATNTRGKGSGLGGFDDNTFGV
jgi:hypothetical protein